MHDPARRAYFTEGALEDLWVSAHLIFGSDIVLSQAIQANRDPALNNEQDAYLAAPRGAGQGSTGVLPPLAPQLAHKVYQYLRLGR